jgi:hypothetical protein
LQGFPDSDTEYHVDHPDGKLPMESVVAIRGVLPFLLPHGTLPCVKVCSSQEFKRNEIVGHI